MEGKKKEAMKKRRTVFRLGLAFLFVMGSLTACSRVLNISAGDTSYGKDRKGNFNGEDYVNEWLGIQIKIPAGFESYNPKDTVSEEYGLSIGADMRMDLYFDPSCDYSEEKQLNLWQESLMYMSANWEFSDIKMVQIGGLDFLVTHAIRTNESDYTHSALSCYVRRIDETLCVIEVESNSIEANNALISQVQPYQKNDLAENHGGSVQDETYTNAWLGIQMPIPAGFYQKEPNVKLAIMDYDLSIRSETGLTIFFLKNVSDSEKEWLGKKRESEFIREYQDLETVEIAGMDFIAQHSSDSLSGYYSDYVRKVNGDMCVISVSGGDPAANNALVGQIQSLQ